MKFVFRTDASNSIGTGHIMRCLALAEALRQRGGSCLFICRAHPGNLISLVNKRDFEVQVLPFDYQAVVDKGSDGDMMHADWLGGDFRADAESTMEILSKDECDWLIIDHYAIDFRWQRLIRRASGRLMAIDDLANRTP